MSTKTTAKKLPKNQPLPIFLKPKEIKVVDKKALRKIADSIYNRETGNYLNLCAGTLQNGPDPVCATRTMHCGLGELYFVITGKQPEDTGVNESGVVQEVIARSTIGDHAILFQKKVAKAQQKIEQLDLPEDLIGFLTDQLEDNMGDYVDDDSPRFEFKSLLDEIPNENDQGEDIAKDFKPRAQRVAELLRHAAELLPR